VSAAGRRVVVTGMAGLCALGADWKSVREGLLRGASGVARIPAFAEVDGLRTQLGAAVAFERPPEWPRKAARSLGRVSQLAVRATELALTQAGLAGSALLRDGSTGIAYGSTSGSPPDMVAYAEAFGARRSTRGVTPTEYLRFMSHTCAANLASFFGVRGRVLPTPSACTSGSQAIGFGYEAIRFGRADRMLCGGAEELHPVQAAVFDLLFAASTRNDAPQETPRPFDAARAGLVVGEGAATLVLEEREQARARGAAALAEVVGFGTNCDGGHLTAPDTEGMEAAMRLGLADAGLAPADVGYVSAHATATEQGDRAESEATRRVFGARTPISSLKGHLGHTLGACGALEAWLTLEMLREGWFAPTLHLAHPDPECAELDYVMGGPRRLAAEFVASHNFAFGGVNTSLVLRRVDASESG
jgi:3-oxoacyl-[acyl-carrier-protein] synthase II